MTSKVANDEPVLRRGRDAGLMRAVERLGGGGGCRRRGGTSDGQAPDDPAGKGSPTDGSDAQQATPRQARLGLGHDAAVTTKVALSVVAPGQ